MPNVTTNYYAECDNHADCHLYDIYAECRYVVTPT
jgi:hypothetical protein